MTRPDYAYTRRVQECRRRKAAILGRWCYDRGIGPRITTEPAEILRHAAHRAGVTPPHLAADGRSATWELVAELLHARARWDRAHDRQLPHHVHCIACTVLETPCVSCAAEPPPRKPACCRSCGEALYPGLFEAGITVHPTCPEPPPETDGVPPPPWMF